MPADFSKATKSKSKSQSDVQKIILNTQSTVRLDLFLRDELPSKITDENKSSQAGKESSVASVSNSKIRRMIISGAVSVNGKQVERPSFELRGKSEVCVLFDREKFFYEKQPDDISFCMTEKDILFEDENLIFVNKPSFFPVEQTITGNRDNLHDAVVDYLFKREGTRNPPYVGIMHRLDRETSGVIVFTKTRAVNAAVSEVFQTHNLIKKYLAVVEEKSGTKTLKPGDDFSVEFYMGRITGKSAQGKWGRLNKEKGGQFSHTDFHVLKKITVEGKPCVLVECILQTGRTHQIRVHLSSLGFPILGDSLYGSKKAQRLYLHSARLAFKINGREYDVSSSFF